MNIEITTVDNGCIVSYSGSPYGRGFERVYVNKKDAVKDIADALGVEVRVDHPDIIKPPPTPIPGDGRRVP